MIWQDPTPPIEDSEFKKKRETSLKAINMLT
jgi:hypothetical protein